MMEGLMHAGSFPQLTPEDQLAAQKWNWRLALVCGTVVVIIVVMVAARPYTRAETAAINIDNGFPAAAMIGFPP
jgi:hypothetical protein